MATTYNTYTGDNSIVDFSFTFPYLNATDIKVSLDKVVQTLTTHYTLHNATTIRFGSAPGTGVAIKIYRDTDSTQLSSTFYPGSAIRSGDLNENFTQNLYVTQEAENDVADAIRLSEANVFTATQTYDNDQETRFNEADANGSAYVGLKGATDKGTQDSYTLSLPAAPPAVNQILRAGAVTGDLLIWSDEVVNSTHVTSTDNESTNENNLITFVEDATTNTGNVGLEMDGDFHYNPSTGTVTATVFKGNIDAVDGDFDGTLEADAYTVNGATLQTYIGTVSSDAGLHVRVTDNESTNENNLITFVEDANTNTGNVGLEFDGDFHYNPSTGTVTATTFKGDIDANNGDFDGTLEADAYTINGVTLASYISGVSSDSAITATNANHVTITNNASTNENNLITFIEDAAGAGDRGLESDGDLHYNPSTGTVTATVFKGRVPNIPENAQGSYTLVATDAGKFINSTGTVTVPNSIFSAGDMVTIFNNSTGDRDITQGTGVTMYLGDGDGGNDSVKLGQRCVATILFITTSICVIQGGDLT